MPTWGAVPPSVGQVALRQGDVYCAVEPTVLTTVLGSCVAVCLWDKLNGIGGMNHFVLPYGTNEPHNARYGDVAMDDLESGLRRLGSRVEYLQAKVFGGAAVLPCGPSETVGESNVRLALHTLRQLRIPVIAQRTGGSRGQNIRFHTGTGAVLFRYLTGIAS